MCFQAQRVKKPIPTNGRNTTRVMVRWMRGHDDHREQLRGDPFANLVGDPGGKIRYLAYILVETVEGFAGGYRQRAVAWAAQDAGKQVAL